MLFCNQHTYNTTPNPKPHQVVMVELCKERVGLLVDGENEDRRLETWHCRCD